MGITTLRKALAARARGHVLEVAVGTGRNLAYYDWSEVVSASSSTQGDEEEEKVQKQRERMAKLMERHRTEGLTVREQKAKGGVGEVGSLEGEVLSFTGVDVSGEMVGVARDRVREAVPGLKRLMRRRRAEAMPTLGEADDEQEVVVVDALDGRVRLVLGDAVRGLPSPAAPSTTAVVDKYDTILQTFGLCSVADPARLLANMAAKVQPDSGRIILLEHGRGWYEWINTKLDEYAPRHFQKYARFWYRDIVHMVREAAQTVPGLEVVKLERPLWFQAGTTLLIELRVNSQQAEKGKAEEVVAKR
jgi:methyltransferase OMS1